MKPTILFDLDDTLLENSTSAFIPAYIESLCGHLSQNGVAPSLIFSALMSATEEMHQNTDPSKTLKEVFDSHFYPSLDWEYDVIMPQIEEFYRTIYPQFREVTSPNSAAQDVVSSLIQKNIPIVIATNPIFPQDAVIQRLAWSCLEEEIPNFSLITSYEKQHFTKPHLAYYVEILALLGWPEGPLVMVGDDFDSDINPACTLGIPAYWINENGDYTQCPKNSIVGMGSLQDFPTWLEEQAPDTLLPDLNSADASIAIQQATPAALSTLLSNIPDAFWHHTPDNDGWTLTEICCHLRDVDREIYIPRIQQVMNSKRPFLEAINADAWAEERNYQAQDGALALSEFITARLELLSIIHQLPEATMEKEIRHTIFGPISLPELLRISARHDKLHTQQVFENLRLASS